MARISELDATLIYDIADTWRKVCLIAGKSLFWEGEQIWSERTLRDFKKYFTDNPDESQRSFEEKFKEQLAPASLEVTKLACELVFIYFLFPSSVTGNRKRELINLVASWKNVELHDDSHILARLDVGIGGPGLAYNTRRPFELAYLGDVALRLASMAEPEREAILSDDVRSRTLLDETEGDSSKQSRDILLHLLFPDKYERIASRTHKQIIAETFSEMLDPQKMPDDLDDRLYAIRIKLTQLLKESELDFYWPPLRECWYVTGEEQDLNPLQALAIKRQIVFYGPPGTGKTFEARALADRFIRQGLLKSWGPKRYFENVELVNNVVNVRIRRIQFHPGYSYEDLVRGLRLGEGGKTEYSDGILLRVIAEVLTDASELNEVPFVLILDELNRADLSKVLGECFSLLEDRDAVVQLAGLDEKPREVSIPQKLHFIGTMNLIDQSLEQVDFALRRRFLWFPREFDYEKFLEICRNRWEALRSERRLKKDWERFRPEFEVLGDRAQLINSQIEKYPSLGPQYQIGHTYFCDVVHFIEKDLVVRPGRHFILYSPKGHGRDTTVGVLWKYSLKPLLEQYLSGIEAGERQAFLTRSEDILMGPNVP